MMIIERITSGFMKTIDLQSKYLREQYDRYKNKDTKKDPLAKAIDDMLNVYYEEISDKDLKDIILEFLVDEVE